MKLYNLELHKKVNGVWRHFGTIIWNVPYPLCRGEKIKREANTGRFRGENGPNWQGGIGSFPYGVEWTIWLRKEIKERDNNQCRICGEKRMLDVHHIDFDKQNNKPSNLITLCKHHHGKANRHAILQVELNHLLGCRP